MQERREEGREEGWVTGSSLLSKHPQVGRERESG